MAKASKKKVAKKAAPAKKVVAPKPAPATVKKAAPKKKKAVKKVVAPAPAPAPVVVELFAPVVEATPAAETTPTPTAE